MLYLLKNKHYLIESDSLSLYGHELVKASHKTPIRKHSEQVEHACRRPLQKFMKKNTEDLLEVDRRLSLHLKTPCEVLKRLRGEKSPPPTANEQMSK